MIKIKKMPKKKQKFLDLEIDKEVLESEIEVEAQEIFKQKYKNFDFCDKIISGIQKANNCKLEKQDKLYFVSCSRWSVLIETQGIKTELMINCSIDKRSVEKLIFYTDVLRVLYSYRDAIYLCILHNENRKGNWLDCNNFRSNRKINITKLCKCVKCRSEVEFLIQFSTDTLTGIENYIFNEPKLNIFTPIFPPLTKAEPEIFLSKIFPNATKVEKELFLSNLCEKCYNEMSEKEYIVARYY
jgi:hypothetical protein